MNAIELDTRTPRLFAIQHPDMSEALVMEDSAGRTESRLIVWAQVYMLRNFDVTWDDGDDRWVVAPLAGSFETVGTIDLFEDAR